MIRGTTPTHIFTLPFDTSIITEVRVIYSQNDAELFTKPTADVEMEGTELRVKLTQDETFKLDSAYPVQIQLRVLTEGGDALATDVYRVSVDKCLSNEVLTHEA